ncbi:MAG: aminomethyltransferase family protein, partial [Pseudomonadota bacterium]
AISAGAAEYHDWDVLRAGCPQDYGVTLTNVTNHTGCLVLAGPRARDILQKITRADLSNEAFPWMGVRTITIGFCNVLALRVNYVGELGWELHMPMTHQVAIYEALCEAGAEYGLQDFGMYAMDSLRIEKCYRGWKTDLVHEYSPLMSALDRFVDLDKPDFPGRQALLNEKQQGSELRFVPLLVKSEQIAPLFCSTVWDGDDIVGLVTAGGYGHRVKSTIALAYMKPDYAKEGTRVAIDIAGERYSASVTSEPVYDPKNERLKS